jgi:hypothetical protein
VPFVQPEITTESQQIISSSPKPPLSILDCRAGTYIKLGEFEKALKDGKRMIKGAEEKAVVGRWN